MFKRRTTKVHHRRQPVRVLRANVMTPRILWFDLKRALTSAARILGFILAAGLLGWGLWFGIRKGLFESEEFALRELALNDNPVVDRQRLIDVSGIDLSGSLFECDVKEITRRLAALPEVAEVKVRREFPGKLEVAITPRVPLAWIANVDQDILPRDQTTGLLVDREHYLFSCAPGLFPTAANLPVIAIRSSDESFQPGTKIDHPDYLRGMRLYQVALATLPESPGWIDTISQHKGWASKLLTRDGVLATFGHENLETQMTNLLSAIEHARQQGDRIATIQLIGKRNLPVTLQPADDSVSELIVPGVLIETPAAELPPTEPSETQTDPQPSPSDQISPVPKLEINEDLNTLLER